MHEAGLARGVSEGATRRGLRLGQVRLALRGGQPDFAEFNVPEGMR